jgi:peptidoglycan hydrolase-like protein with peptidoglycan-binding domain
MMRAIVCLWVVLIATTASLQADERTRQVQEELRKRNLYYGNVDGQQSPELSDALKRYQNRKGFAASGSIDDATAISLHIQATVASAKALPDLPVLRSDAARDLPDPQRVALEKSAEENLDPSPTPPPPPAESPAPGQDLAPDRVTRFVEDYLRDAETDDIAAQVKYFVYPIEYFDHGAVDAQFVLRDVRNYVKRWPQRKYTLTEPVTFFASGKEGETLVEFVIAYHVQNSKHTAAGRTKNWWTLRPEGNELKIVAIREQRLRE